MGEILFSQVHVIHSIHKACGWVSGQRGVGVWLGGVSGQRGRRQNPPEMATAMVSMYPTGMHSC